MEENRVKNRKGVQKFRARQKELKTENSKAPAINEASENQPQKPSTTENTQNSKLTKPSPAENNTDRTSIPPNDIPIDPTSSQQYNKASSNHITRKNEPPRNLPIDNNKENRSSSHSPTNTSPSQMSCVSSTKTSHNKPSATPSSSTLPVRDFNKPIASSSTPQPTESIEFEHSYKTQSALSKAVAKTKKSLPTSPSKRKAVMARLLRTFSEEDQKDIIGNNKSKGSTTKKGLRIDLVKEIRDFYERDDISRISPNVKDSRKFADPDTGEKLVRQVRHLNYKLSEVYDLFMAEYTG